MSDSAESEEEITTADLETRLCAASDIPVHLIPTEEEGGTESSDNARTLAPASAAAIEALIQHPEADWAKAAAIEVAGRRRVWYAWTQQDGVPDGDYKWNHDARFVCDKAEAGVTEDNMSLEGSIDAQTFEGYPKARVEREVVSDDSIMEMYRELKNQISNQ